MSIIWKLCKSSSCSSCLCWLLLAVGSAFVVIDFLLLLHWTFWVFLAASHYSFLGSLVWCSTIFGFLWSGNCCWLSVDCGKHLWLLVCCCVVAVYLLLLCLLHTAQLIIPFFFVLYTRYTTNALSNVIGTLSMNAKRKDLKLIFIHRLLY